MEYEVINVRDVIISEMKKRNLAMKDMYKKVKVPKLFASFMAESAFLTFDLADNIGFVLDIDPLFLIENELKYMQKKDRKDYENLSVLYKITRQKFVKTPSDSKILQAKKEYINDDILQKLYMNYIQNNDIKNMSYNEFEVYFKKVTNIEDINHIIFQKFHLLYKELDKYQAVNMIFWTREGEFETSKKVKNQFDKKRVLNHLIRFKRLKKEKNNDLMKEELNNICNEIGVILLFKKGQEDVFLDGFCKWYDSNTPLIIVKDMNNAEENYQEFIKLFSYIIANINNMSRSDKSQSQLYFYDTKLINFGEEYDNYIRDYNIINANDFMNKYFNIESEFENE